MAQAGITGNFAADAFTLTAKHFAHALQFKNDAVDLLHRGSGNAPDQRVQVIDDRLRGLFRFVAVTAQMSDVAADELADLTFESGHRRLFRFGALRGFPVRGINLRACLFRNRPVRTKSLGSDGRHGPLLQKRKNFARMPQ